MLRADVENQWTIDRVSAGTILKSTYGIDMQSKEGCVINELAIEANSALVSLGVNGLTAVDLVPIRETHVHLVDLSARLTLYQYATYLPGFLEWVC